MSIFRRAQDITISIRRDAEPVQALMVNSGSLSEGLGAEEVAVAGKDTPYIDGTNGAKVLTLDLSHTDPAYHTLVDAQEAKNRGDEDAVDMIIDAEFTLDYGRLGRRRVLLPDCTASEAQSSWSGGSERVTSSLTLTSDRKKALA